MWKQKNKNKKQIRKPVSQNFDPKRLAINYEPPTLILQYLDIDTGKLYHHKMRLDSIFKKKINGKMDILNYIKIKHHLYFVSGKVKDKQILKFIQRISKYREKHQLTKIDEQTINSNRKAEDKQKQKSKFQQNDNDFDYLQDDEEYEDQFEDEQDESYTKDNIKAQQKPIKSTFLTYCQQYGGNRREKQGQEQLPVQASWDLDMDDDADFV